MERKADNVILFPKWKQTLEQESLRALEESQYEKALEKLNQLLKYGERKYEIMTGKIICLMELDRYEEAQTFCETCLKHGDDHYFQYFHMYVTILFQTSQYQLLMEEMELKWREIPSEMTDSFEQLYTMSQNMQYEKRVERGHYFVEALISAIRRQDYQTQWRMIEKLSELHITPSQRFYNYLIDDTIHPVVKTTLFHWLQQDGTRDWLEVSQENGHVSVQSSVFPNLKEQPVTRQVMYLVNEYEQKNPSQFYLMEQLLYRYLYVCYPILPPVSDAKQVASALVTLGDQYLQNESAQNHMTDGRVNWYIQRIKLYETLYLSILDD